MFIHNYLNIPYWHCLSLKVVDNICRQRHFLWSSNLRPQSPGFYFAIWPHYITLSPPASFCDANVTSQCQFITDGFNLKSESKLEISPPWLCRFIWKSSKGEPPLDLCSLLNQMLFCCACAVCWIRAWSGCLIERELNVVVRNGIKVPICKYPYRWFDMIFT